MPRKTAETTKTDGDAAPKAPARKRAAAAARARAPASTSRKKSDQVASAERNGDRPGLVIVESPKKARSIGKFLGSAYVVKASMGHVRDLPKRKLGLEVAQGYKPSYEVVPAKKETIADLKRTAARSGLVYLATDPDREGEAIAWHLQQALDLDERPHPPGDVPRNHRAGRQGRIQQVRPDQHGHGQRPAGAAVPGPRGRLSAEPAALEKGRREKPECRACPVGRGPADRRPRARDQELRHRGILEDRRRP